MTALLTRRSIDKAQKVNNYVPQYSVRYRTNLMSKVHLTFIARARMIQAPASIGVLLTMENDMSHYTLVSGALVALALGTMVSASHADSNYGPRQQGGKCFVTQGSNSLGYWGECPNSAARTTGATANARIAPTNAKKGAPKSAPQR